MYTNIAEFAFVAASAEAFAAGTFSVAGTVGHFAFVVFQTALAPFPSGIALALAVDVVATAAAQHRANTFCVKLKLIITCSLSNHDNHWRLTVAAVVSAESGFALASTQDAFAVAVASARATQGHVASLRNETGRLLRVSVVVVKRNEPVAGVHVLQNLLLDQSLHTQIVFHR